MLLIAPEKIALFRSPEPGADLFLQPFSMRGID
jgi:hypothetical protein